MDTHSPHAHPTARGLSDPAIQSPSTQRRIPFSSNSPTLFSQSLTPTRANSQQRQLQLRYSAFGTQLSAPGLGAHFSRIFHGNEEPQSVSASYRQQEKTPEGSRP